VYSHSGGEIIGGRFIIILLGWSLVPLCARAQRVHVYGPDGTGTERRAFAVFERGDGSCAPAEDVTFSVDDERVQIEGLGSAACVSSLRLTSSGSRQVQLTARVGEQRAATHVSVGTDASLAIEFDAHRAGPRLLATLPEALDGAVLEAHWSGGSAELRPSNGHGGRRFETREAPTDALVAVVAHAGGARGLVALPAETSGRRELLVLPSPRGVPSNGHPRSAALLVVTNANGVLSSSVPLRIQSDRGTLQSLDWLRRGIASVTLSTSSDEANLDLRATVPGEEPVVALIPIMSGWPATGTVRASSRGLVGEAVDVWVSASTAEGASIAPSQLRVRCGGEDLAVDPDHRARCAFPRAGATTITALVHTGGVNLPVGHHDVLIEQRGPTAGEGSTGAALISARARVRGGVDAWSRPTVSFGLGIAVELHPLARLAFDARYEALIIATGPGQPGVPRVEGSLAAIDHLTASAVSLELRPLGPLLFAGSVGVEVSVLDGSFADADLNAVDVRPFAEVAAGVEIELEQVQLGARVGVWAGAERVLADSWGTAPVRGFVEVIGAIHP